MNRDLARIYGDWIVGAEGAVQRLAVGEVLGSRLRCGADGKPAWIDLQWRDPNGATFQLEFPFVQAMFVLSVLKSHQLDSGLPFPDDPRAPSARG